MPVTGLRHLRHRHRLEGLVTETGGGVALARIVGTPQGHISALLAGRHGIGDALADELEKVISKPAGWMGRDGQPSKEAAAIAPRFDALPEGADKEGERTIVGVLPHGDVAAPLRPAAERKEHGAGESVPVPRRAFRLP